MLLSRNELAVETRVSPTGESDFQRVRQGDRQGAPKP